MSAQLIFLTHAEVAIDANVPVPDWPLNDLGRARHAVFAKSPVLSKVSTLFSSHERKARDGAEITGQALGLAPRLVEDLGENDRSATGYLPPVEFEAAADAFFAAPATSYKGWERATDAQARIVRAITAILQDVRSAGDALVVSHGAVGALFRCYLKGIAITRAEDQPHGGGCYFACSATLNAAPTDWIKI